MTKTKKDHLAKNKTEEPGSFVRGYLFTKKMVFQIADEVVKKLRTSKKKKVSSSKLQNPWFLDTSAIIDGRVFDLIKMGVFSGNFVVIEPVLSELKNIADSKEDFKKQRGRNGLASLELLKKERNLKLVVLDGEENNLPVDDKIIREAKHLKGRIITCDYSLCKKARIGGVVAIDIHEMANLLKTSAVPGESFFLKIVQEGKGREQGVGYLPDGTMVVVEKAGAIIGKTVKIVVSRIIQTEAGRILFAKIQE